MQIKAPLEYVWRPIAEWIDRWLEAPPRTHGGLLMPIVIWGGAIFWIIVWVLS